MRELNAEQASSGLRTLNDAEIETVSGGKIKIIAEAYIPFAGTFIWFSNGGLSFLGDDWTVINSSDR